MVYFSSVRINLHPPLPPPPPFAVKGAVSDRQENLYLHQRKEQSSELCHQCSLELNRSHVTAGIIPLLLVLFKLKKKSALALRQHKELLHNVSAAPGNHLGDKKVICLITLNFPTFTLRKFVLAPERV